MWYQDTELLGSGVQPERKGGRVGGKQPAGQSQRPGNQARVILAHLCVCILTRPPAFQGKDGFGAWAGSLFLDMILTVNPSGLNSGANGLSEVMEITFQITQQKNVTKKIYLCHSLLLLYLKC